jgi:acyl-CoA synthetase (AMP-forming)/AMP-acid ligase II
MDIEHPSQFAQTAPERPAVIIVGEDTTLTYGALEARSNQVAHALRALGLRVGDHVAVLIDNRAEYFEVIWGAMRSGLLVTPINWHLSPDEAEFIVKDCGATALIASDSCAHLAGDAGGARVVIGDPVPGFVPYEELLGVQPTTPIVDECEGNWMFYSSGTTGRPKGIKPPGVGGPLGAPTTFTALVQGLYGGKESTRYLSPAPLYHAAPSGWSTAVHRLGGTVIITKRFDPVELLETIERHRATLVQVVPTHLVRLLKLPEAERSRFDLSSLEVLVHAAAPCPPDVKRAVIEWVGPVVYEYYSGSEGVGFCAIGPEEWLAHPGSVGRSLLGTVHIVDDHGNEVPPGTEGQVWFETQSRFEYHGDPDKTAAAFDHRGWSNLGDMGRVDDDGYLYLTDRVSNMIISGGVNIYPREVEDALIAHPDIVDVAVIGVADEEMGESVRAIVQPRDPPGDPDALAAELVAFCRDRIAHFKCPRSVVFVDELPRLPTGKIARRLFDESLRAPYDQGTVVRSV